MQYSRLNPQGSQLQPVLHYIPLDHVNSTCQVEMHNCIV